MKRKLRVTVVLLVLVVMLAIAARQDRLRKQELIYAKSLDVVAVTVDDVELTLRDIAVYVAYQEKTVQKDAVVYDYEKPHKYWNTYTNQYFVRSLAEKAVRNMAIHDEIFYQMALEEGLSLDEREEAYLLNEQQDFLMDLSNEQMERLGVTEEELCESMRKIALANKCQSILAQSNGLYYEDYNYTGAVYELILAEHKVKMDESVWDRISVGNITVNY